MKGAAGVRPRERADRGDREERALGSARVGFFATTRGVPARGEQRVQGRAQQDRAVRAEQGKEHEPCDDAAPDGADGVRRSVGPGARAGRSPRSTAKRSASTVVAPSSTVGAAMETAALKNTPSTVLVHAVSVVARRTPT